MSTPKEKKGTSRGYHHGNLRHALIETSLEVIAEGGVRALTLREIGVRLNVSRMAPYRHFADKSALLAAITAAGFQRFAEALEGARHSAPKNFAAQADALAAAYVQFAQENRAHFEVMFGGGGEPQYLDEAGIAVAQRSFLVLENVIREGQSSGDVAEGDATRLAQMLWALVHGIGTLWLDTGPGWEFTQFCGETLRAGLLPRK